MRGTRRRRLSLGVSTLALIHPTSGEVDSPKSDFGFSAFSEVHQRFIADSSPVASVNALCCTAAGLRAVSPLYATRREEDVEDQPLGGAGGGSGGASGRGLLVLMLVLVEVQPAEATFPGQNGRIAYSSLTKTDYNIFPVKATGGGEFFNVTDNTTDDFSPAYSPNGRGSPMRAMQPASTSTRSTPPEGSPLMSPRTRRPANCLPTRLTARE